MLSLWRNGTGKRIMNWVLILTKSPSVLISVCFGNVKMATAGKPVPDRGLSKAQNVLIALGKSLLLV